MPLRVARALTVSLLAVLAGGGCAAPTGVAASGGSTPTAPTATSSASTGQAPAPSPTTPSAAPQVKGLPAGTKHLTATTKDVVAKHGQQAADDARAVALLIGYKMATHEVIHGTLKGNDVLLPLQDVATPTLLGILRKNAQARDAIMLGNYPGLTVTESTPPRIEVGQPMTATVSKEDAVGVTIDIYLEEVTEEYGRLKHHRHITAYLTRQPKGADLPWMFRAAKTTVDDVEEMDPKNG